MIYSAMEWRLDLDQRDGAGGVVFCGFGADLDERDGAGCVVAFGRVGGDLG